MFTSPTVRAVTPDGHKKGLPVQELSFDFKGPLFRLGNLQFGVQVFTFENVYGLDELSCTVTKDDNALFVKCGALSWAGGQEVTHGQVLLRVVKDETKTTFEIEAECERTIRCTKLFFRGLPDGEIMNLRETKALAVPPQGLILKYPDGWRGLYTPLIVLRTHSGEFLYFRSLATDVREMRFALNRTPEGLEVELIFEELATEMGSRVSIPAWEVGRSTSLEEILCDQVVHVERSYGLVPWETRDDVPSWARDISLVAAIHCRHWTGYVFNDYSQVLETVKWLVDRIEPKRLLVYLPGWEGRYYWHYGDYRPDPRMGGEEGFARLIDYVRETGAHAMPMFGINYANKGLTNFEQWGAPVTISSAGGLSGWGSPDWDASRHYDHSWGAALNPGAPTWQNRLVSQITTMVERYGFDGVYLDISAVWVNDPRYNIYRGVVQLVSRIREDHPELLIGGEGWYDGVGLATPLMMSGHTEGEMHWHDEPYPDMFERYHRSFAHLCLGDPGRGSTGVHELGTNLTTRVPLRRSLIPTLTIVDDTLEIAPSKVQEIIDDAKRYANAFLNPTH